MQADKQNHLWRLPIWRGEIAVEVLPGGLSNESYVVSDQAGKHVARFGEDYPFHDVSRDRELMIARAASAAGFGPAVEHAEPGVVVSAFIEAKTLAAEDVRSDPARIAGLLRGFHNAMPRHVSGSANLFWPFHTIRDYARTLRGAGSRHAADLPRYLALADELEQAQTPLPIIFAHNDLLPANFLDDGQRLWLIDYEYAGYSTAMFDLANAASNAGMDDVQAKGLLDAYFETSVPPELIRSHAAMQCTALLREAMWSMVSEIYLKAPGADYAAYTAENLQRLEHAVARYRSDYSPP